MTTYLPVKEMFEDVLSSDPITRWDLEDLVALVKAEQFALIYMQNKVHRNYSRLVSGLEYSIKSFETFKPDVLLDFLRRLQGLYSEI